MDRIAIQDSGIPGIELMNRAGAAAFEVLRQRWPETQRIVILCGGGNNGGDGYVVARLAHNAGLQVTVVTPPNLKEPQGDALEARDAWLQQGGRIEEFDRRVLNARGVLVDGLLGTGLDKPVRGAYAEIIEAVNRSALPVLALDISSGLNADTGVPLGGAIRAECTVTFVGLKRGLFTGQALDYCGELRFSDLAIPAEVYQRLEPDALRITPIEVDQALQPRQRNAHKGDYGHVLVVGGDQGMSGAVRMAAEAAARVGAGLVSVATRSAHAAWINLDRPELMIHGVEDAVALRPLLDRATVIAIGPGLGRSEWARSMLTGAVESGKPMVVDADALNLLAMAPHECDRWILTPHPGEAGRLLGVSTAEVQEDRFAAVRALQARYGGCAVLKGAGSLISSGTGPLGICTDGNPGMASGGMGDVLTGIVAGLRAQGLPAERAARVGVAIHARAADLAALTGERGLLASDLFPHLRRLVNPSQ